MRGPARGADEWQNSPSFQRIAGTSCLSLVGAFAKIAAGFWGSHKANVAMRVIRFNLLLLDHERLLVALMELSRLRATDLTNTPW